MSLVKESEDLEERLMRKLTCLVMFFGSGKHIDRVYPVIIKAAARTQRRREKGL